MLKLNPYNDLTVENAYIITVRNNQISETLSARCQDSCRSVGQPYTVWDAFDGTNGDLQIPNHLRTQSWLPWIKLMDTDLSTSEVACFLSHFSLWCHCLTIDQPIVILEHDAVMVNPYRNHLSLNQIVYLGCREQAEGNWPVTPCPPYGTLPRNKHMKYILRTHAYAVDPMAAKRLVSYFINHGIWEELAVAIRADIFNIVQVGLFAYDKPVFDDRGEILTTIVDTKEKRYSQ